MNVNINIKNRLNHELRNGITLEQLKSKLYSEMDWYDDCGYTCSQDENQAIIKLLLHNTNK